jgi:hypothetical protein
MNGESLKRQRLTPVPGEQGDINMSHISDNVLHSSSGNVISNATEKDEATTKVNTIDDQQEKQVSILLKKVIFTVNITHVFANNTTRSMI